jgi:hypothetical protein
VQPWQRVRLNHSDSLTMDFPPVLITTVL